jgi:hypothetical protein
MSSFKDYTLDVEKTNKGVKLPLFDREGNMSEDYIMVRWVFDDEVRAALADIERKGHKLIVPVTSDMSEADKKDAMEKNDAHRDILVADGMVSQVAGWSFSEKPTKANVKEFLKTRPDIAQRIDTVASSTNLFFGNSDESS